MSDKQTEFADFFRASWKPCLRAVVAVAGNPQLAEDQVAEAFAKAWMSWRKVRRHPAPRAWVVRTALNAGASWWRRHRRELPLADYDLTAPGPDGGRPRPGRPQPGRPELGLVPWRRADLCTWTRLKGRPSRR